MKHVIKTILEEWQKNPDPVKMEKLKNFLTNRTFTIRGRFHQEQWESYSRSHTIRNMRFRIVEVTEIEPSFRDYYDYEISFKYEFLDGMCQHDYSPEDGEDWDPDGQTYEISPMDKDEDYGIIWQAVEQGLRKIINRYFSCKVEFFMIDMINSKNYIPD